MIGRDPMSFTDLVVSTTAPALLRWKLDARLTLLPIDRSDLDLNDRALPADLWVDASSLALGDASITDRRVAPVPAGGGPVHVLSGCKLGAKNFQPRRDHGAVSDRLYIWQALRAALARRSLDGGDRAFAHVRCAGSRRMIDSSR
jgi:hypothetical protein